MWWVTDQHRLGAEKAAISALDEPWFENADWSIDNQLRLQLIFDIVLDHGRFRLAMVYHSTFPASPPSVRPIENVRLSSHQYGPGGDLCPSIRNDNWSSDVSGADMIYSVYSLLEHEAPDENGAVTPAPSGHDYPAVLALRHALARFYVSPSAHHVMLTKDFDAQPIKVGIDYRGGGHFVAHLFEWGHGDDLQSNPETPASLRDACLMTAGVFYKSDASATAIAKIKTVEDLSALIGNRFTLDGSDNWACVVRGLDDEITLLTHLCDDSDVITYDTILAPFELHRSGDAYAELHKTRVGIVGLGSLGSKIAVSLARSGVGRFDLIDGDILYSGNLERHDGDWRDVGRHKSDIAARRLRIINATVDAQPWRTAIGAQISAQEAGNVNAALSACDMLIDATANPDVFNHLAYIALQSNRDFVWGAVYAGGLGGEIARSRHGKDPSPYDIRQAMNQVYEQCDVAPPIAAGRGYDGLQGQDAPLIATDADVSVIAAHMSALTLDTLIDADPSNYQAAAYLIGMKGGWLFEAPFDTQPLVVEAPIRESLAPSDQPGVESDFIKTLIQKFTNEAQNQQVDD